jgi:hypothetical protein
MHPSSPGLPEAGRDHVTAIQKYMQAINGASDMHALIVEGQPGWGKTTAVEEALRLAQIEAQYLGAYSTPLNLYNFLHKHAESVIILDDVSGVFTDSSAMALLKAATRPARDGRRTLKWGSTSSKVLVPEFDFTGKLIIVCNSFPNTPDAEAIRSRSYARKIDITVEEAKRLLLQVSQDKRWYAEPAIAAEVADFLVERLDDSTLSQVSFRTLKKGYRLAEVHRESWRGLFADILPRKVMAPEELVLELSRGKLKIKDQARRFETLTGLKERSFYNYRKSALISRAMKA